MEEVYGISLIDSTDAKEIEQHFAMSSLLYGRGLDKDQQVSEFTSSDEINSTKTSFDGLRIDICANKTSAITSVITTGPYKGICETFMLPFTRKTPGNRRRKGFGGNSKTVVLVIVQVPF